MHEWNIVPIQGLFSVTLVGILWGLNWPTVKFLLTEIEPLSIRAIAFPLAALALAMIAHLRGESLRLPRREILPLALTGLFLVFGFNALTSLGQVLVETSKAAIIAYTMPALTAVLSVLFLKERLHPRLLLALLCAMAGLAALAFEDLQALIAEPLGPLLMLMSALSWAIGNVALKSRIWTLQPIPMTVWFFILASVLIWPIVLVFENPLEQTWPSPQILATFAFHITGPMVLCYIVWTTALARVSATTAAIAVLSAPLTGVVSSILLLGEPPSLPKFAALALILGSIAITLGAKTRN